MREISQKIKFLLCDTWPAISGKKNSQKCGWKADVIRFLTPMGFNKFSRLLVLILKFVLSSFWLLTSIMIGYMWKKLSRLRVNKVIRIRPVTSPGTFNTTREGKYFWQETNRDTPGPTLCTKDIPNNSWNRLWIICFAEQKSLEDMFLRTYFKWRKPW